MSQVFKSPLDFQAIFAAEDARFGRRCAKLAKKIGEASGESILRACQDWTSAKAAYRFLSNARVDESDIIGGRFDGVI